MKRGVNRKLEDPVPPAIQKSKNIKDTKRRPLKPSISEDNLLDRSNRNTPQRKASTPTHDRSTVSVSPDISCILTNDVKPGYGKNNKDKPQVSKILRKTSTVPVKEADILEKLDFEYTQYINALFKGKLVKTTASNIDDQLENVQKRIAENENILRQTTERLKNISFNKEVDLLHSLHNPNFGKALETLDESNCGEYLSQLNERIERTQNQLRVKNLELPQGGGDELITVISDTLAAFEKLKSDRDVETPKVLAEIKEANKDTVNALLRCRENLPTVENLLLTRAVMDISVRNTT